METEEIIKAAIATVGVTQLLKSFIPVKRGWVWAITTIFVGIMICIIPTRFLAPLITVSGATLFYDTIYQTFEKLFKRGNDE